MNEAYNPVIAFMNALWDEDISIILNDNTYEGWPDEVSENMDVMLFAVQKFKKYIRWGVPPRAQHYEQWFGFNGYSIRKKKTEDRYRIFDHNDKEVDKQTINYTAKGCLEWIIKVSIDVLEQRI